MRMKFSLADWATREYADSSRPCPHTLRRMAADGEIPGAEQSVTRRWWVVVDEEDIVIDLPAALRQRADGDDVLIKAMGL